MTLRSLVPLIALAAAALPAASQALLEDDFSRGMANWWVEGGERVWVEDGRLHVRADNPKLPGGGVATVWSRTPVRGDFRLEVEAHVVSSTLDANNINLFFCYTDPAGKPLEESRDTRRTAGYDLYHKLNGYIITFLNDYQGEGGRHPDGSTKARYRIRRDPGFQLLNEKYDGWCRQGVTYKLGVTKRGGRIAFAVDGREVLSGVDPAPLEGGYIGLRTFRTYLWWDNLRVVRLP